MSDIQTAIAPGAEDPPSDDNPSEEAPLTLESLRDELKRAKAHLRIIWQVICTAEGLSTTISGMNAGLEVVLLQYFGIKKNINPALAGMPGSLLNNGVDTHAWQAKIAAANTVSPMVWQGTEEGSSLDYGNHLRKILALLGFESIHKVYLVHKYKEL